jgi:hypothetical protein
LNSIRAMANWRLGNEEDAVKYMAKALPILMSLPPQVYSLLVAYRILLQITFEMWEQGKTFKIHGWRTVGEIRKTFISLQKMLRKFRPAFPIGEPSLLFYRGLQKWMEGKGDAAHKDWQAGVQSARQLSMTWDEANILREIGKCSEGEARRINLEKALALFISCQAQYDMADTKKLLKK